MRTKLFFIVSIAVVTALFSAGCSSDIFKAYKDKSNGEGVFLPGSIVTPDKTAPDINTVTATSHTNVRVTFNDNSQRLDKATAETTANYLIQGTGVNPDITVTGASLVSGMIVDLTVDGLPGMVHGATYNLVVQNVKDGHDNPINPPQTMPFYGRGSVVADLTNKPANPTNNPDIDVTVGGTDIVSYQYRIDGGSWSAETQLSTDDTITITGLTELPNPHVLEVVGKDSLGNWQSYSSPTSYSWEVDLTAPTADFLNKPADPTNIVTTNITVAGTGVAAYKYRLDSSEAWSNIDEISGSAIVETVGNGSHTIEVIARDAAGNWQTTPTEYTWAVDTTQKFAVLSQTPTDPTSDTGTDIIVGGDGVVEYAYRIDGGAWDGGVGYPLSGIDVADHIVLSGLSDGSHTIEVIGHDDAGNWTLEADATDYTWTVDTIAPTAKIATKPVDPSNDLTPSFTIAAADMEGDDTVEYFRYRLYKDSVLVHDWSILNMQSLPLDLNLSGAGTYQIDFVGLDAAYNEQNRATPTSYTWEVDTTEPTATISGTPTDPSKEANWDFTVGGDADMVSYVWKLDGGSWSAEIQMATTTMVSVSGLTETPNPHVLYVRGKDDAGNWQTAATTFSWTVDQTAPVITLTNTPANPTNQTSISVTVNSTATDFAAYKYYIDSGPYGAEITDTSAPITASSLGVGTHNLYVMGRDTAGNWSNVAHHQWVIDLSTPTAEIVSGWPGNPTRLQSTDITIGGSTVTAYGWQIDNHGWNTASGAGTPIGTHLSVPSINLEEGTHTLYFVGRNAAGGWQSTSAPSSYTWRIDITAPTAVLPSNPANPVSSMNYSITVTGTSDLTYYKYQVDSGSVVGPVAIGTPVISGSVGTQGSHTITVWGGDDAGNWQSVAPDVQSKSTYTWTVDTVAPTPPAVTADYATTTTGNLSYHWTNTTDFAEVKLQLVAVNEYGAETIIYGGTDGASLGTPSPASGTQTWTRTENSTDGWQFKARVKVRDAAGNWSAFGTVSSGTLLVGNISGTAYDPITSGGINVSGVALTLYRKSNDASVATATSASDGTFTFSNVPVGDTAYYLRAVKTGYKTGAKTNLSSQLGVTLNCGIVYMVPDTALPGYIRGRTVDANTGDDVSGVTIQVLDCYMNLVTTVTSGPTFDTQTTHPAQLDPGVYYLVMSKTTYFTLTFDNIIVNGNNGDTTNTRYALCKEISEPQLRVIVQWGADPHDLDLHVVGPTATQNPASEGTPYYRFHVSYHKLSYQESSGTYNTGLRDETGSWATTSLVQDNTSNYGPESINLFGTNGGYANGVYTFSVHDYSDRSYSTTPSENEIPRWYVNPVTMRIFDKDGLVRQISVPTGASYGQDCWKAIKITMTRSPYSRSLAENGTFFNNTDTNSKTQFNW